MPTVPAQAALEVAIQHHQAGRLAEAAAIYRQLLAVAPSDPDVLRLLGIIALQTRQPAEALDLFTRAIVANPAKADSYNDLGNVHFDQGRFDMAIAAYRKAVERKPDFAEAHYNLGNALAEVGDIPGAISAYQAAIHFQPDHANASNNLGTVLYDQGNFAAAAKAYRSAIDLDPGHALARMNLGNALLALGQCDAAVEALQTSVCMAPTCAPAHCNLANALKEQGRLDETIGCFRRAVELNPDDRLIHSNLIYTLLFHPASDAASIGEEQRRWTRKFAEPLRRFERPHANDRDPERRLRVGYVSPDFRRHVIRHFLVPLLEAHDSARFELHCYASVTRPDAITERIKKSAHVWRDVLGVQDEALAEQIRADGIDILVDLTQHMERNRLTLFARKPAPIQVAWVGYPGSTGLPAMDYRITDKFMEPEGSAWSESVETAIRLPDSWFCFDPIDDYPEPNALPALRAGHVTFGSLNNFCKANEGVLQVWAAVLRAVEDSRLLLQCPAGATEARVRQWFESQGIAAHRLELVAKTATRAEFLELFERIDLAFDPFPYNGGTTTCEALWMGVPVPAFPGSSAVSRIGLSILSAAGLRELVAGSQDEYLALVIGLASDLPRLAELRSTLRGRMKTSAFMDAPRFARNIEAAYRTIWQRWCAQTA